MKATLLITLYRDKRSDFRWKLTGRNGRLLAEGGEGYKRRIDAVKIIRKIFGDRLDTPEIALADETATRSA